MSVDLRPMGSSHWYNPNRDLVSQTTQILREATLSMVDELLPLNHAYAKTVRQHNLTMKDMIPAADALADFVVFAADKTEGLSLQDAIEESGFTKLSEPVLHVMFSLIAQNLLGRFYQFMRKSAHPELVVPMFSKESLLNMGEGMKKMMSAMTDSQRANLMKDMQTWATKPAL